MPYPVSACRFRQSAVGAPITPPVGFTWNPPLTIYKNPAGAYQTSFSVQSYAPTGTAYYVDIAIGNDSNSGTAEAPLKGIDAAIAKADAVVVYIKPGTYHYADSMGATGVTCGKNIALKRWPGESGRIVATYHRTYSFTRHGTYTHCYSAATGTVNMVLDTDATDEFGDYNALTKVADAATCDSTEDSWFFGSGTLYIHRADDAEPTVSNTWVLIAYSGLVLQGNFTFYMEYMDIIGINVLIESTGADQSPKLYAYDCTFKWSPTEGVDVDGAYLFAQLCKAAQNMNDGFNYGTKDTNLPHAVELDCENYHNGPQSGDTNNQGSSAHTGYALRLNCEYHDNHGPNIFDLGYGWFVGCDNYSSDGPADHQDGSNYVATGSIWAEGCISRLATSYDVSLEAGAFFYYRDFTTGNNNSVGGATYEEY